MNHTRHRCSTLSTPYTTPASSPAAILLSAASEGTHLVGVEPSLDAHAGLVLGEHLLQQQAGRVEKLGSAPPGNVKKPSPNDAARLLPRIMHASHPLAQPVLPPAPLPTWIEWKEKPGCTLKKAMLFHSGSAVAVGITSGSCGVSGGKGQAQGGELVRGLCYTK